MSSYIKCSKCNRISIHALREESDRSLFTNWLAHNHISIHALREESDGLNLDEIDEDTVFQSTLSVRRAT